MPSPQKASPMAGLGSVEDRVSAYRGNPAPLQQRYAMSQDLLDLLALQKLKSEKEAAARQMQLAMGQQAAAQGAEPPTIAQQREKEVMDMTKNELAQQRGATADQQVDQQKAMAQRMMGGIAGAPGAATAAQPKMMASGGIVAFSGEDGSMVEGDAYAEAKAEYRRALEALRRFGGRQKLEDPQGYEAAVAAEAAAREAMSRISRGEGVGPVTAPPSQVRPVAPVAPMTAPMRDNRALLNQAEAAMRPPAAAQPPASGLPGLPSAQTAPSTVPRPAAPGAAPGAPAPAAGMPTDPLAEALRKQSIDSMNIDPAAQRLSEEARIEGKLSFPEEQARRRAVIDAQRKMYEQEFDPERQRREGLKQFLINSGGRRYGEFAGGARGAMAFDKDQSTARQTRLKGLEDMEQGLFGLTKGAVEGGIGAGKSAFEQGSTLKRQGMETGRGVYATETQSRDNALNREIERMKVAAQNEANKIGKEGLNLSRAQTLYSTTVNRMQQLERKLDEDFAAANGMLIMAQQSGKIDKAQQQQLEIAQLELQRQKAALRKEMEPVLGPIRQQLGANASAGLSQADQSLVDQYLKK
jgi:hypothetical protein